MASVFAQLREQIFGRRPRSTKAAPIPKPLSKRRKSDVERALSALAKGAVAVNETLGFIERKALEEIVPIPGPIGVLINVSPLLDDDIPGIGELRLLRNALLALQRTIIRD